MRQPLKLLATALLLPLLWLAAGGDALAVSTTGTLRGRVTDEKGEGLPGVTVIARSEALIHERATQTDTTGKFELRDLPPGTDYRVVVQMPGYITMVVDTSVELDAVTEIPVAMRAGENSESITVTAVKPVVDKTSAEMSPVFDPGEIDELPVARQFQSLLTMAPGVNDDDNDGNPSIAGGTGASNTYVLDGMESRDPVTGTFGENLNYDSVDQVEVKLVGVSAEYGQFQGGNVNIVTKSGSNEFTGSIRDEISDGSWQKSYDTNEGAFGPAGPPPLPGRTESHKSHDLQATLGGPVVRDNAWFFIAYSRPETSAQQVLFNPTGGPFGNGTYNRLFQGDFSLGKLSWQISNNHRVQGAYQEDPSNVPICYGAEFFGGPCYDSYNVDLQDQGGYHWIGLWSATWTPTLQSEVRFGHFKNSFAIQPLTPNPGFPDLLIPSLGGLGSGVAPAPFIDVFTNNVTYDATIFGDTPEDRKRDQVEAKVNYFFSALGDHSVRAGVDYRKQETVGSSIIAGNALFFGTILPGGGDPTLPANRSYYLWYDFAPPSEGGPTTKTTALYVQDDWSVNPHLALGLGLRYEDTKNENDLGEEIVGDKGFAPRLSATYDVTGEGKYLVKGTASRYLAGINLTTLSPFIRAAGGQASYDVYLNTAFPAAGIPATTDWSLVAQVRPDPDSSRFDPDLKPQYLDEFSLGYDHLFTPTFGGFVRYVDREWKDIITQSFSFDYSTGVPRKIVFAFNNPDATRTYKGILLQLEKRFSNRWSLLGNYTHGKAEGNVQSDQGFEELGGYVGVPQVTVNRFGLLDFDIKDQVKLFGRYDIPIKSARHSLGVGSSLVWQTGSPWAADNTQIVAVVGPGADGVQTNPLGTRVSDPLFVADADQTDTLTEFFEPRGSQRQPDNWALDLQLNYKFMFSKRVNFEARMWVNNVTNEQEVLDVFTTFDPAPGADNATVGFPVSYDDLQTPRTYGFNFAVTW